MFFVVGMLFGVFIFCPWWDRVCDMIFGEDSIDYYADWKDTPNKW